jgi:hypothetical protein
MSSKKWPSVDQVYCKPFFDDIEPEKGSNTQRLNEELPLYN